MAKRFSLEVDGAQATFRLLEDWVPNTAAAFWASLPVETSIAHVKRGGDACYFNIESGPAAELAERPELGVTSIYKGYIVLAPKPAQHKAEMLISYGLAEYRGARGRQYATPVAELEGDGRALLDALRRTHLEGQKALVVRKVGG